MQQLKCINVLKQVGFYYSLIHGIFNIYLVNYCNKLQTSVHSFHEINKDKIHLKVLIVLYIVIYR